MKIDKYYTIKYSKSGISQYADFNYSEGKLISHTFYPRYSDNTPLLEGLNEIEDILKVIQEFSYNNQASIWLLNGLPLNYPKINNDKFGESFEKYIGSLSFRFFKKNIFPILKRNKWKISYSWMGRPVFIERLDEQWINIDSDSEYNRIIQIMCSKFLSIIGIESDMRLKEGYIDDVFPKFYWYMMQKDLEKLDIFVSPEELTK